MDLKAELALHARRALRSGQLLSAIPAPPQEPVGALDALVAPFERVRRRGGEHRVEARRIGAVFVDQRLRVHAVVLGLRHRADTVIDYWHTVRGALRRDD